MKYFILSIVFMLFFKVVFSQNREETRNDIVKDKKSGEIVRGKNVAYKVVKGYVYSEITNVVITDSVRRFDRFDWLHVPKKMREQIEEIVFKHIKPEDLRLPCMGDWLLVNFILNEDLKIEKISFGVQHNEGDFWINLPVDRYHEIEKEMMKLVPVIEEKDKKLIREMDFKNGAFCTLKITYDKYLYEKLKAEESVKKK